MKKNVFGAHFAPFAVRRMLSQWNVSHLERVYHEYSGDIQKCRRKLSHESSRFFGTGGSLDGGILIRVCPDWANEIFHARTASGYSKNVQNWKAGRLSHWIRKNI